MVDSTKRKEEEKLEQEHMDNVDIDNLLPCTITFFWYKRSGANMSNVSFGGKHYSLFCFLAVQVSKGRYRYSIFVLFTQETNS